MKKSILYVLLIAATICSCSKKQQEQTAEVHLNTINFRLEGIQYDSLFISGKGIHDENVIIAGKQEEKGLWTFNVPDSICDILPYFEVRFKAVDTVSNISYRTMFEGIVGGDTTNVFYFNIDEKYLTVHAKYIGQDSYDDNAIVERDGKEKIEKFHFVYDKFLILNHDSSDVCLRVQEPYFSYFWDLKGKGEGKQYDDFIREYTKMAAEYPDSRYLITNLSRNLFNYKSRDDLAKIYNSLSDKYKNTTWGQNIERYLNAKFENTILPSGESEIPEPVIKDTTKYNLVIFSASWCKPCREEIPLLKRIYDDLKGKLDMVYVTIDEKETVPNWKKLMQDEKIPWRSVLASDNIKSIREKYYIGGVPQVLLVQPNGRMDILDVRQKKDKEKLYQMVR